MRTNNIRNGFTMIELIFVIVILGILSAVALPKMLGTQKSAVAQKVEFFVGTANRTTLPSMYVSALRDTGSIKTYSLSDFVSIPDELTSHDLSSCGANSFADIGDFSNGADLFCRDGNSTSIPIFAFTNTGTTTLDSSYFK